ncbi:MAG: invasion associated locus B family protein [Alphaproteobacteria bacterium]|nr:invasion associated locus B family protein [Alphaproteobacteria bacterium]
MRAVRSLLATLAIIVAWAAVAPADAQETRSRRHGQKKTEAPGVATERIDDWMLRCEPQAAGQAARQCEMVQLLSAKDGKRDLLLMRLAYPPAEKGALALIVVPLDVLLPAGLGLRIDQREPVAVAIRHCEPSGCVAPWRPSSEEVAALAAGKELLVLLRNREGKQLGLPVSLKGFAAAHAKLH